jgi:TatD DNase family protein
MYIDAHAHLDRFEHLGNGGLDATLEEIEQDHILTISNSMDVPSYERNQAIAARSSLILPIFGVHPWNALQYLDRLNELERETESSAMIGEVGLDHHWVKDSHQYPAQKRVLVHFLRAAEEQRKVVNLHAKGAEEEILGLLDGFDLPRIVVHWYSGPLDVLQSLASRGVYFTVGIEVLYSAHIQRIAQLVPGGQLLTETDNPGGPKAYLGRPGTPALIREVVRGLAGVRNISPDTLQQTVQANLQRLIGDDPWIPDSFLQELRGETLRDMEQETTHKETDR